MTAEGFENRGRGRYYDIAAGEEISRREYEKRRGRPLPGKTPAQLESLTQQSAVLGSRGALYVRGVAQPRIAEGVWLVKQIPADGTIMPQAVQLSVNVGGSIGGLTRVGEPVMSYTVEWDPANYQCLGIGWVAALDRLLRANGEDGVVRRGNAEDPDEEQGAMEGIVDDRIHLREAQDEEECRLDRFPANVARASAIVADRGAYERLW